MGANKMSYEELLQVFMLGIVFGILMSVLPFVIGEAINTIYKIMKGGV